MTTNSCLPGRTRETRTLRINGVRVRVPDAQLTDTRLTRLPGPGEWCGTTEPDWPDDPRAYGIGGSAVCTLWPHATGPDGTAHIAHGGREEIIAIWWDAPAGPEPVSTDVDG